MSVTVNILHFPGTNCERETFHVFQRVGATPRLIFFHDVLANRDRIDTADILCIPGGFSFGDHVGAGAIAAQYLTTKLATQFSACRQRPMICICNGFQIAVRAGVFGTQVALVRNRDATFQHMADLEHCVVPGNPSPWLKGLGGETLKFPCGHGQGRFVFEDRSDWVMAMTYLPERNPNGSMECVAGITSNDGLVLGSMNHPERAYRDPRNMEIFRNGVRFAGI